MLLPLCVLSLMFLLFLFAWGYRSSDSASAAAAMPIPAASALFWLCTFMATPILTGDALQYYQSFVQLRNLPFAHALQSGGFDILFTVVQWTVGQLSDSPDALFAVVLAIYMTVFLTAQIRLAGVAGAAMLVMVHLGYPDFVTYGDNTIRQGIGMVFLLAGIVGLSQGSRRAWAWIVCAPLWHSGIWLAVGVIAAHQLMCRLIDRQSTRWWIVCAATVAAILLSWSSVNQGVITNLLGSVAINQRYDVYLGSDDFGYRTGFRVDFFLFSMIPVISALVLRKRAGVFDYERVGWWLSLYLSLNVIYHLFSFAPFSNRFADFSWFLIPTILFCQVRDTGSRRLLVAFVTAAVLVNLVMLGTYTGSYIPKQAWQ